MSVLGRYPQETHVKDGKIAGINFKTRRYISVCEARFDQTIANSLFHLDVVFLPYRLDRNCNGGGVTIFV